MIGAFALFTGIFVLITLLPLTKFEVWWVRGFDFPRLQFAILGLILLTLELYFLKFTLVNSVLFSITLACLIYQISWIIPYTRIYSHNVLTAESNDPNNTISILVANVLQSNRCHNQLLELIQFEDPLLFVTLETNKRWEAYLDKLSHKYPYSVKCPLENLYGMHVYSKLPLKNSKIQFLEVHDIPSIHTGLTLPSGKDIALHFLHPIPPRPSRTGESTQRDAELLVVGKAVGNSKDPVIVTGDLNDVAWSRTTRLFLKISHLLDPRVGRGMFNTFHAGHWFLRWPLDHLFHSNHFTLSKIKRLKKFGSDHFPVFVELVFDENKRRHQKIDYPDRDEKEMINKKIAAENLEVSDVHKPV